ncbi:MAG: hypothetical protein EOP21_04550 [Hyphomicrobiales bacterium]|nr:MAG: hypothetical protein EOP21_04550 [Hyphomicrobiales bacterium]
MNPIQGRYPLSPRYCNGDDGLLIAVLGDTGNLGLGLARRWALAGHELVIGSRSAESAAAAAAGIADEARTSGKSVSVRGLYQVPEGVTHEGIPLGPIF